MLSDDCGYLCNTVSILLNKQLIIKQTIAAFLCCVFLLAITPKKILHDCLASHKDAVSHSVNDGTTQLHKAVFHCHYDTVVVSSPFVSIPLDISLLFSSSPFAAWASVFPAYRYRGHSSLCLRGPPAFIVG